ncbi:MAG: hypothetical protein LBD04_01830 [Synergistaceae bacterium]|jgi:hypothetical protein|nr:hypothetical protein [Synergistaceae bacterium]
MEKFLSYAERYEDWFLYYALTGVEKGFYVDVSANHPWDASVTKAFYDRGRRGTNIEPLEEEYNALCGERVRDVNLNVGSGKENGEIEFFIGGLGSTCVSGNASLKSTKKIIPSKAAGGYSG